MEVMKNIDHQVNYFIESFTKEDLIINFSDIISLACQSSQYMSKQYNPVLGKILKNQKSEIYFEWSIEEISSTLN